MLELYFAIFIALLVIFVHWQVFRHWLPRSVARVGLLIFTVNLVLLILFTLSSDMKIIPYALIWNLDIEDNIPSIYSTVQLSSVALVAILVVFFAKRLTLLQRSYWLALSLTYFVLSADELTRIHDHRIHISNIYLVWGGLLAIGTVCMLLAESKLGKRYFFMVLLGLAISALGGLILDRGTFCFLQLESLPCTYFPYLEETLELAGNGLILVAVLGYASYSISLHRSPVLLGLAFTVSFIWPGLPVSGILMKVIIPLVDLQTRAQNISVELTEAPVQVLGFWQGTGEFAMEREITLHLYLRTDPALYDDFGFSYTLLDQNTQEVVAKSDHWR